MDVAYYQEKLDSSPRTRRYFLRHADGGAWRELFSAHAEVFPSPVLIVATHAALLRARGGISFPFRLLSRGNALLRARGGISHGAD